MPIAVYHFLPHLANPLDYLPSMLTCYFSKAFFSRRFLSFDYGIDITVVLNPFQGVFSLKKQSLLQGVMALTSASLLTKILGFAASVMLARILGAEGIGLQMMVMPLMGLLMTLTTLGLPTAVAKAVAEADATSDTSRIKRVLILSLTVSTGIGILLVIITLNWAHIFAEHFLADQRSYYSLLALVPVIPILAISGIVKGYFRGKQNMNPLAVSQVLEQIVRMTFLYVLVQWLIPYGVEYAAAGAILAGVVGEAVSLIYLIVMFNRSTNYKYHPNHLVRHLRDTKDDALDLFHTGLPQTGSGFFRSILRVIQPVLITRSLAMAGVAVDVITEQYGMLTGFVFPLLFMPGFLNYSLGLTLVPAISEAHSRRNRKLIHHRVYQSIRMSLLVGVPSTAILFTFSDQLLSIIYQAPEAGFLLSITAPFFLFQYFHSPLQATLVGLGAATPTMVNNIVAKCVGLALIFPLAVTLELKIVGVALAFGVSVILETILHISSLTKRVGFPFDLKEMALIFFCGILVSVASDSVYHYVSLSYQGIVIPTVVAILLGILLYLSLITSALGINVPKRRSA